MLNTEDDAVYFGEARILAYRLFSPCRCLFFIITGPLSVTLLQCNSWWTIIIGHLSSYYLSTCIYYIVETEVLVCCLIHRRCAAAAAVEAAVIIIITTTTTYSNFLLDMVIIRMIM